MSFSLLKRKIPTLEKISQIFYLFLTYLTFKLFQHWLCKMSDNLQSSLDDQLASFSRSTNVSIRVFRLRSREGLVRARLVGSEASTGNVLVFLDAHCEVTEGWLPPLLDEIRKNRYFRFLLLHSCKVTREGSLFYKIIRNWNR